MNPGPRTGEMNPEPRTGEMNPETRTGEPIRSGGRHGAARRAAPVKAAESAQIRRSFDAGGLERVPGVGSGKRRPKGSLVLDRHFA